jgi:hypothetical protein
MILFVGYILLFSAPLFAADGDGSVPLGGGGYDQEFVLYQCDIVHSDLANLERAVEDLQNFLPILHVSRYSMMSESEDDVRACRVHVSRCIEQIQDIVELVTDAMRRSLREGVDEQVVQDLFSADTLYGILGMSVDSLEIVRDRIALRTQRSRVMAVRNFTNDIVDMVQDVQQLFYALPGLMVDAIHVVCDSESIIDHDGVEGLRELLETWAREE